MQMIPSYSNSITSSNDVFVVQIEKDPADPRFTESCRQDIQGLQDRGTIELVDKETIPENATILRPHVIHGIKTDATGNETFKTRLVILGHRDSDKGHIVNEAPTILRASSRIILSLASILGFKLWSRDVKQAFVQSEDKFNSEIYVRPPRKPELLSPINQPQGMLKALKPLYGIPEAPMYWWHTFKRHHMKDLGMSRHTYNRISRLRH